jgi:hypothetical protein
VSIGPAGEAIALWSLDTEYRVTVHSPAVERTMDLPGLSGPYPTAQPLPDGRILGVNGNATVWDANGQIVAEGTFGFGVKHVRATPSGRIWVGYNEDGVQEEDELGGQGLAQFPADLQPEWLFPFGSGEPIRDCYALSVADEKAWACYYARFPIVCVDNGVVTSWANEIRGVKALAVDGDHVGLFGGSWDARARFVVGRLEQEQFVVSEEHRLVLPDGGPILAVRAFGLGADLHLFVDRSGTGSVSTTS